MTLAYASAHKELHYLDRAGWLRAAVLGANDGIVPLEQSQALLYELEQAKVEARLIVVPGKRHWFRLDKSQAAEVARFFQTHFEMLP